MTKFPAAAVTLAVAVLGAVWGTGMTTAALVIAVGQEGIYLPVFLSLGPLLLVSEHLPVPVTMFGLVPAYYGAATAALWHAGRSRFATVAASTLYALLLAGPALGAWGHLWSDAKPLDPWLELEKTYDAARDVPWWFTALFVGLSTWHAFAWRRLGHHWSAAARPTTVRWLAAGVGSGLFGGALAWAAMALLAGDWCGQLPGLLVFGPFTFLDDVPIPISHFVKFTAATATLYGLTGLLLAAARERRDAFWPALATWGLYSLAVASTLVWVGAKRPGYLQEQAAGIGPGLREAPPLFLAVFCGQAGWQAFVVWSLWKSRMRPRGVEAESPTPRGFP